MIKRPKFPQPKEVMIIADYPVSSEPDTGVIFSSASHVNLLQRLKKIAGIDLTNVYTTYLSYYRPSKEDFEYQKSLTKAKDSNATHVKIPFNNDFYTKEFKEEVDGLFQEIEKVSPKLIIIIGKFSFYFLAGKVSLSQTQGTYKSLKPLGGLDSYRGSQILFPDNLPVKLPNTLIFPLLPLSVEFKQPKKGIVMNLDLKRVGEIYPKLLDGTWAIPSWILHHSPDYPETMLMLTKLLDKVEEKETLISVDIETLAYSIDRISFATSKEEAFSILFGTREVPHTFTLEEETLIVTLIRKILLHKNCKVIGQNWSYDRQYLEKFWLCPVDAFHDTMIAQHVLYNFMQKSLDYLASIYCDYYEQWKTMQDHTENK